MILSAVSTNAFACDEVLQVVLQYRMQKIANLLYLKFNFEDLENILQKARTETMKLGKPGRVMERICYLAEETRLEGENRR